MARRWRDFWSARLVRRFVVCGTARSRVWVSTVRGSGWVLTILTTLLRLNRHKPSLAWSDQAYLTACRRFRRRLMSVKHSSCDRRVTEQVPDYPLMNSHCS